MVDGACSGVGQACWEGWGMVEWVGLVHGNQVPVLRQGATLPCLLLIWVSSVLLRPLHARWGSWRTWKATSNCSHGRGSPLGQARRAAISEYAPGAP
jgi:hypothetical protein